MIYIKILMHIHLWKVLCISIQNEGTSIIRKKYSLGKKNDFNLKLNNNIKHKKHI